MRRLLGTFLLLCLSVVLFGLTGSSQNADDHGNDPTPFAATLITVDNVQLEGQIETIGDVDCFMFEAIPRTAYRFEISEPSGDLEPLLILFDTNSLTVIALDDGGENGAAAKIEWQPIITGFYYLCVRNSQATVGTGSYLLRANSDAAQSVETTPAPPTSEANSMPNADEQPASGETIMPPESSPTSEDERAAVPPVDEAQVRVGVLGGDDPASLNDVRDYLAQTGAFFAVDLIDVSEATPTASQLQQFDSVLVWSDSRFADAEALGTLLADYVDGGGGVVVAAVSFDLPTPFDPDALGGRFLEEEFYVIAPDMDNVDSGRLRLGTIHATTHPIMVGVDNIDGGPRSFHSPTSTLTSGGTAIASWDNGDVLVAVKTVGTTRRADINLFPPSGRVDSGLWPFRPSNKVPTLFANALLWVAGRI